MQSVVPPLVPHARGTSSCLSTVLLCSDFLEGTPYSFHPSHGHCSPRCRAWHTETQDSTGTVGLVACKAFTWHAMGHVQPHLDGRVPGMYVFIT